MRQEVQIKQLEFGELGDMPTWLQLLGSGARSCCGSTVAVIVRAAAAAEKACRASLIFTPMDTKRSSVLTTLVIQYANAKEKYRLEHRGKPPDYVCCKASGKNFTTLWKAALAVKPTLAPELGGYAIGDHTEHAPSGSAPTNFERMAKVQNGSEWPTLRAVGRQASYNQDNYT